CDDGKTLNPRPLSIPRPLAGGTLGLVELSDHLLGPCPKLGGLQVSGSVAPLPSSPRSAANGGQHDDSANLSGIRNHRLNHPRLGPHSFPISIAASLYSAASAWAIVTAHTALSRSPCLPAKWPAPNMATASIANSRARFTGPPSPAERATGRPS